MGNMGPGKAGRAGGGFGRSVWALPLLLTFGLTATDLWCDLLGHSPASAAANNFVWDTFTNGRVFWSLSFLIICSLMVAFPKEMERAERVGDCVTPLIAAALVAAYPLLPQAGPAGAAMVACAIVITGMCYGWMEVRLLAECARPQSFAMAFWALAASQAIKVPLTSLVAMAPAVVQTALTALLAASLCRRSCC